MKKGEGKKNDSEKGRSPPNPRNPKTVEGYNNKEAANPPKVSNTELLDQRSSLRKSVPR